MAKRDEFPANQNILARIRAMMHAISTMRVTLRNVETVITMHMEDSSLRSNVIDQIHGALLESDVASDAITGEQD